MGSARRMWKMATLTVQHFNSRTVWWLAMSIVYIPTDKCPKCPFNGGCKEDRTCFIGQTSPVNTDDIIDELRQLAKVRPLRASISERTNPDREAQATVNSGHLTLLQTTPMKGRNENHHGRDELYFHVHRQLTQRCLAVYRKYSRLAMREIKSRYLLVLRKLLTISERGIREFLC